MAGEAKAVRPAILLVDHGSRRAAANESLSAMAELVRERGDALVSFAHMELCPPDIASACSELVEAGATSITVQPFMLSAGRHAMEDIPRMVGDVAAQHPHIAFHVTAPLGVHTLLAELVLLRVSESRSSNGSVDEDKPVFHGEGHTLE